MPGTFTYAVATKTVTVTGGTSGSPADFASFVAADRAGTGTSLLAAWAPTGNTKALTYQVRPVELLALLISFVVASKTAETDYIFITGTDAWGAAQTESLDVSAGNGTYVTTKRFKTITNIDCSDNPAGGGTVWADGTVAVTQPIWGVIWNKGGAQYQLDAKWAVGDASTSTYFAAEATEVYFNNVVSPSGSAIEVKSNATFRIGRVLDAATKRTANGCMITFYNVSASGQRYIFANGGTIYICSSLLLAPNYRSALQDYGGGVIKLWNSTISGPIEIQMENTNSDIYNLTLSGHLNQTSCAIDRLTAYYFDYDYVMSTATLVASTVKNIIATGFTYFLNWNYLRAAIYAIDCEVPDNMTGGVAQTTGAVYRQQTFNLHVTDQDGNNLSGANVILKDREDQTIFDVDTDANGEITFSGEDSSPTPNVVTNKKYWYSGGNQSDYRGPWTLTITKDGYQDYQDVIVIDRTMDLEVALLGAVVFPSEDDVIEGVDYGQPDTLTGTYHGPLADEVKDGVLFGPSQTYEGTYSQWPQPTPANVLSGVSYGDPESPASGIYHEALPAEVVAGVLFGPSQSYTGLYEQWPQPDPVDVIEGVAYGDPGSPLTGVYHEPLVGEVAEEVAFGPNSEYIGTFKGGGTCYLRRR